MKVVSQQATIESCDACGGDPVLCAGGSTTLTRKFSNRLLDPFQAPNPDVVSGQKRFEVWFAPMKSILFDTLAAAAVTKVVFKFSGQYKETTISLDCVSGGNGGLPKVKVAIPGWTQQPLSEVLKSVVENFIEAMHPYWYYDVGGQGEVEFDAVGRTVNLKFLQTVEMHIIHRHRI